MRKLVLIISLLFAFASTQGQGAMFLRGSQPAPTPGAGLLDSHKGAAFAMAPDVLLYSTYSALDDIAGSETFGQTGQWSVAILRDSDNAIRSFTPGQVADGTANAWVQAAGAANGFVRRAYDQSVTALDVSNLNHANQTTTANMPKLFDSSTGLITEGGKAAIQNSANLAGVSTRLSTASFSPAISQPFHYFIVHRHDIASRPVTSSDIATVYGTSATSANFRMFAGVDFTINSSPIGQRIISALFNSSSSIGRVNGVQYISGNTGDNSLSDIELGDGFDSGKTQLILLFPENKTSITATIEGVLNTEYNIY